MKNKLRNTKELFKTLSMIKERFEAISYNCEKAGLTVEEKITELYSYYRELGEDIFNNCEKHKVTYTEISEWINREIDYIVFGQKLINNYRNAL